MIRVLVMTFALILIPGLAALEVMEPVTAIVATSVLSVVIVKMLDGV